MTCGARQGRQSKANPRPIMRTRPQPEPTVKQFMHVGATAARRAASPLQSSPQPFPRELVRGHRQRVGGKNVAVVDKRFESLARSGHIDPVSAARQASRAAGGPPLAPRSAIHSAPEKRRVRSPRRVESQGRRRSQRVDRISRLSRFPPRSITCPYGLAPYNAPAERWLPTCSLRIWQRSRRCAEPPLPSGFWRWFGGELRKSPAVHIATRVMAPQTKGSAVKRYAVSNTRA